MGIARNYDWIMELIEQAATRIRRRVPGIVLLLCAVAASAQEPARTETVTERSRPELSPTGIIAGSFVLYPQLTLSGLYDDNILAARENKGSGFAALYSPKLSAKSNWGAHALNILAAADIGRYSSLTRENYEDWEIYTDARLDVRRTVQLSGGIGLARDHVERISPTDADGLEPTEFYRDQAYGRYTHRFGRFFFRLGVKVIRSDFNDVLANRSGSVVLLNQDDRDRTEYTTDIQLDYEVLPEQQVFIRATSARNEYDELQDITNLDRSSEGHEIVAGLQWDLDGLISGDIYAGGRRQDYEPPFPDVDTPVYGLTLHWNPTRLSTVGLMVERSINETIRPLLSAYVRTRSSVSVDHELRRDILLNAGLHYYSDRYEGIGAVARDDTTYDVAVGPKYLVSRNLHLLAQYHYLRRDSNDNTVPSSTTDEFKKNIILFQIRMQR